jgi:pilus assembly protein Flp/PilA
MVRRVTKIVSDEKGATAVEYGLILAMIVLAMLAALSTFAERAVGMWNFVSTQVTSA